MKKFASLASLIAIGLMTLTGCYNRYQNPYNSAGCIAPPGTGYYNTAQNPQQYYQYQQYQTPPPAGYQAQNSSGWSGATVNSASLPPTLPQYQTAPANYEYEVPAYQFDQSQQIQPQQFDSSTEMQLNESGFRNDTQTYPQQMHINQQSTDDGTYASQSVTVPVNAQANYSYQQPTMYVPVDTGAIVLPQQLPQYGPQFIPTNTAPMPTSTGTAVARNSTLSNHNPQWQGFR
jgi:hypothetical protein